LHMSGLTTEKASRSRNWVLCFKPTVVWKVRCLHLVTHPEALAHPSRDMPKADCMTLYLEEKEPVLQQQQLCPNLGACIYLLKFCGVPRNHSERINEFSHSRS
jgi:hypothetical protein